MPRVEIEFEGGLWSAREFANKMEAIYSKGGYPEFRSDGDEEKIAKNKEKKVAELGRWMGRGTIIINGEPYRVASKDDLGRFLRLIYKNCPIPLVIRNNTLVFEREKE